MTRAAGRQLVLPLLGLLSAAFVLVPAVYTFAHSGSDMHGYLHGHLPSRSALEWLGLLTPRHVFTSYTPASFPKGIPTSDYTIYLGIAPLILTAAAWPRARDLSKTLLTVLFLLAALATAQMMGMPGLKAIGELPGLRTISPLYWGGLVGRP